VVAQALGDPVLFARAALALGADAFVATIDPGLIRLLERALELLPPVDDPWRAKVAARLAAARQPAPDPEAPIALARDAIAMAHRLGDPSVLRDVLFSALGAFVDFAPPAERAALNTELLPLLAGDTPRTLRTLQRLAFDQIDLGDVVGFELTVARYEALGTATGQPRYQWAPPLFRSMRAYWMGRHDESQRLTDEAYAIREGYGEETVALLKPLRHYMLHTFSAAPASIDSYIELMTGAQQPAFHTMRGAALIEANRLADAAKDHAWLRDHPWHDGPYYHALNAFALMAKAFGDRDMAAQHQAVAQRYAGRAQLVSSIGFMFLGVVDHGLMQTAAVLEHWDVAERYMKSALALCDRLGARPLRERIEQEWATLRGSPPRREVAIAGAAPTAATIELVLEGEYWTVRGLGELCRIKDSRGMQMLARLVADPDRELHVLDLAGADVVDAGDAGTVIDRAARDQYMARVKALQEELAEASAWNDRGRQERLEAELDAIADQLSSAYGLGGREKRTGSATERARTNVRRRLADAMKRIEDAAPALGRHLAQTIRTGVLCVYFQK
jgi:hypothetical protein